MYSTLNQNGVLYWQDCESLLQRANVLLFKFILFVVSRGYILTDDAHR